jgi:alkaline phosphatase D
VSPRPDLIRREVLAGVAALTAGVWTTDSRAAGQGGRNPFTLGAASGSPTADGMVLWTRLAPDPLAADGLGGMTGPVPVRWEVAADEAMGQVVRSGAVQADGRFAHSVHVEVAGLKSDRPYWFRFSALGARTAIHRTRTLPAAGAAVGEVKLALATCAHWEVGYFSAYRHMAAENPDLIVFLGDYIYEYSYKGRKLPRRHDRAEDVVDLAGYRNRYALYKTDPDLQRLHATAPCVATWDDHEVENDYANRWSQDARVSEVAFLNRRAAAYQAFYENMPLRRRSIPMGPNMRLYDRFDYGGLAQITMPDGRQYRSQQPCGSATSRKGHVAPLSCADLADPTRTMLGLEQEKWVYDGFERSIARWNIIPQQVLFADFSESDRQGHVGRFTDGWGGYQAARTRMLQAIDQTRLKNPVMFTGDLHAFLTADLKADFSDPKSRTIASEFVAGSITSDGAPDSMIEDLPRNPHVHFMDNKAHGYISATLTPTRLETRYRAISDRFDPGATISTLKSYVVEDGRPGLMEA